MILHTRPDENLCFMDGELIYSEFTDVGPAPPDVQMRPWGVSKDIRDEVIRQMPRKGDGK